MMVDSEKEVVRRTGRGRKRHDFCPERIMKER